MRKWIRRQAAAGKALNVHAVMRNRPDLLAQAYSGSQPRGWRRCLIDAGVDPYQIVHQHTIEVQCRICGEWRMALERHLHSIHGTTSQEYLDEFGPDCEVTSEAFRVARFSNQPVFGIRHWERLWSRHQVVDWLLLLREKGHSLNYFHVGQKARTLESAALRFFASWDEALKASGLDPAEVRAVNPSREWTYRQVIQQLRAFARTAKTSKSTAPPSLPDNLRSVVMRRFGTLEDAASAAGVELEVISPRSVYKGAALMTLVAAIRGLEGMKGRERRERLHQIYHGDPTAHRIVKNHYGSLRQLALQEGIDPAGVATSVYRDEADVLHDLDRLEREWGTLDRLALIRSHKRLYNVILETGWGADRLSKGTGRQGPGLPQPSLSAARRP